MEILSDSVARTSSPPATAASPAFDTPYIHTSETEEEEELLLQNGINEPETTSFTVHLGGETRFYSRAEFLQACWMNGFETPCAVCNQTFDIAVSPPVRLLSLDKRDLCDPRTSVLPALTITNYHFRCLKAEDLRYFPVSHTWRESISIAYALRKFNADAAQACYEVPIRTLLAVVRRFGSDVYLWHDYISIPQWQDEFRGTTILPQIFEVFKESSCAIIQIGLPLPVEVMRTRTNETIIKYRATLKRLFSAHLFSRLWPVVEFDRAKESYIMGSDYDVMEESFSVFTKRVLDPLPSEGENLQWMIRLPIFIRERQKNKCFGYVYDMISEQKCHSFQHKWIGAAEMLSIPDYPASIPSDPRDACLWLAELQLKDNDFSPLLLRPSGETKDAKVRWLKGHTIMAADMWGWGVQMQSAHIAPRIESSAIYLEVQLAGTVSRTFSWKPLTEDTDEALLTTLAKIRSFTGLRDVIAQAQEWETTLKSLPAANVSEDFRILYASPGFESFGAPISTSKTSHERLPAVYHNPASLKAKRDAMISSFALSVSKPMPKLAAFSDLSPLELSHQLCDSSERTLLAVMCDNCAKESTVRASVWGESAEPPRLYFIPGLAYQYSVPGGTGILVANEEIVGRVRFGAPACYCNPTIPLRLV